MSIEATLRWTRDFLQAEWRLVLPVALAFLALPSLALALALPAQLRAVPQTLADVAAIGAALPPWLGPAALAAMAVTLVGALAAMALALVPRISVGEAIAQGTRRAPVAIAASLLIGAVAFVALVAIGTALVLAGVPQGLVFALMLLALVGAALFLLLLLPVAADRRGGPLRLIAATWTLYRRELPRLLGAVAIVFAASWILCFALQVALGSMLLMAGIAAEQVETGRVLAALLSSILGALQWSFVYVFVAALYRARAGAIGAT